MTDISLNQINRLRLSVLRLDPRNPRLPEEEQDKPQEQIARFIAKTYEPLSVAVSIADHGYFESEPLIAVPDAAGGTFTVVEGNRRLTSIKGLAEPGIRAIFPNKPAWEAAAGRASLPSDYPVLVVATRQLVAPIIGFRHISGILQWDPFPKARFIAGLVDDEGQSFAQVASLVGETKGSVASDYRNYYILAQAKESLGLETWQVEEKFGVFENAMDRVALRGFIGAPDPGAVRAGTDPIPADKTENLKELLTWIFGDSSGEGQVVFDSRNLGLLAEVIKSDVGLEALRTHGDLDAAAEAVDDAAGGPRKKLLGTLNAARNSLRKAGETIVDFTDDDKVVALLSEVEATVTELRQAISGDGPAGDA